MKKISLWIFRNGWSVLFTLIVTGCVYDPGEHSYEVGEVEGYVPVYGSQEQAEIKLLPSASIHNPGKIYTYGKFLLFNEVKQGIHVYDNTDPAAPQAIGFIQLLGNTDMAIKNGVLYADHMGQLVAVTISDFVELAKVGSLPLRSWNYGVPAPGGYFECIDVSKGFVIGWKKKKLLNPLCYAY